MIETSVSTPGRSGTCAPDISAFEYGTSTRVLFGPGTVTRLGEKARELGGSRILLVTDPGLEAVGHSERAINSLREAGLKVFVFDEVEPNPTTAHVEVGVRFAKSLNVDMIVCVGGGSSMDCGKGINFILTNGGSMPDYKGFGKAKKPMLPSIGVPTTAGTGSEAQSYALIADEKTHMKMACGDRKVAFRAAVLDPELTISQPTMLTFVTGVDAIAHAVESYVTTRRNTVSQMFAREAWKLLHGNLLRVLADPDDLEARSGMQLGANLAGSAIENSMLGACHSCANPLTAHYGLTHGVAIGILLPHVVRFNAKAVAPLYQELADAARPTSPEANGSHRAAHEVIAEHVSALVNMAGSPTKLSQCGVSSGILPLLAEEASQQWTARFNPRPVSEDDLLAIYEAAW